MLTRTAPSVALDLGATPATSDVADAPFTAQ